LKGDNHEPTQEVHAAELHLRPGDVLHHGGSVAHLDLRSRDEEPVNIDTIETAVAIPIIIVLWIGVILFVRFMNKKDDEN